MKQPVLIIVKPDGIKKKLSGYIIDRFIRAGLKVIAARIVQTQRTIAEEHYKHIKGLPFFKLTVDYFCGKYHGEKDLLAAIFYGDNAVKKCRTIAGATDPRDASVKSIRGHFGRVTRNGIFENVVHVSSDKKESEREIKLWFEPDDISIKLYPAKTRTTRNHRKRVWS